VDSVVGHFRAELEAAAPDLIHPVRPAWLVPVAAVLVDGLGLAVGTGAGDWLPRVYRAVERFGGRVPFTAVHDWYANTVVPMWGADSGVGALHRRAMSGAVVGEDAWVAALEPALRVVYHRAYPTGRAYATASADALGYAWANGFGEAEAVEYADFYARLTSGANARATADAQAIAVAQALASAYARADEEAFAATYPFATIRASVESTVDSTVESGDAAGHRRAAYGRLADGLADSVGRA